MVHYANLFHSSSFQDSLSLSNSSPLSQISSFQVLSTKEKLDYESNLIPPIDPRATSRRMSREGMDEGGMKVKVDISDQEKLRKEETIIICKLHTYRK